MSSNPGENNAWREQIFLSDLEIPPSLDDSLRRHRAHLAEFIRNLHSAGISEVQIEESVSAMVASYREELIRIVKAMVA